MKKIFKYPLDADYDGMTARWEPCKAMELPCGAQILSVDIQNGKPVMWALVNPDAPMEKRKIYISNTGGELPDDFGRRRFIGTLLFGGGRIVLHVFE